MSEPHLTPALDQTVTVGAIVRLPDDTTGNVEQIEQTGSARVRLRFDDGNPSPLTTMVPLRDLWVVQEN